jgi:holo-[acyl-carrier protein] synthase
VRSAPALRPGIDLIEIERLERALERRPRLAQRLFTDAELDYANARGRPGRHLAARFAAKEAAVKSLGGRLPLRDVEVIPSERGPRLRLERTAAERATELGLELTVSLTHSRELAAAVVVAAPSEVRPAPE